VVYRYGVGRLDRYLLWTSPNLDELKRLSPQYKVTATCALPADNAAAQSMMHSKKWSWLKAWAMQIARRRGMKKAIVALARRLAVILHRIWVDGTEFRWTREPTAAAA
jgi:hypothetical protein